MQAREIIHIENDLASKQLRQGDPPAQTPTLWVRLIPALISGSIINAFMFDLLDVDNNISVSIICGLSVYVYTFVAFHLFLRGQPLGNVPVNIKPAIVKSQARRNKEDDDPLGNDPAYFAVSPDNIYRMPESHISFNDSFHDPFAD